MAKKFGAFAIIAAPGFDQADCIIGEVYATEKAARSARGIDRSKAILKANGGREWHEGQYLNPSAFQAALAEGSAEYLQ